MKKYKDNYQHEDRYTQNPTQKLFPMIDASFKLTRMFSALLPSRFDVRNWSAKKAHNALGHSPGNHAPIERVKVAGR
jgi:hypothetical protein